MLPGLGTVLDRVTNLFGSGYLTGGFYPVLVMASLSLLAGYDASDVVHARVDQYLALDPGKQVLGATAFLSLVAILGFLFWSLNSWFRMALQGNVLLEPTRRKLVERQKARIAAMDARIEDCEDIVFEFRRKL